MIEVASAVIAHRGPYFFGHALQIRKNVNQSFFFKFRIFFKRRVQLENLAGVVFAVMKLHGFGVNVRLKGFIVVWQFG